MPKQKAKKPTKYKGCTDCGKKETAELGGKKVTFRKGGLHRALNVPMSYKFTVRRLQGLKKVKTGEMFTFNKRKIKMTSKIKKQITLGINLMRH